MDLAEFEKLVSGRLDPQSLGGEAHLLLAPKPRRGWKHGVVPDDCRTGAALVLCYPRDGAVWVVLTVRHSELSVHAGQVSLPGGAVEDGESVWEAALREANEEVGLDPSSVRVLGELSPLHIPVSGFVVHPVLAVADRRPELRPEPAEVDRVIEVSLDELCDPGRLDVARREREGVEVEVPFILVDGEKVWGATAMILGELLSLIGRPPSPRFSG